MHNQKKIIYSIYMKIKSNFKNKLGRKFKVSLIEQISITIFKLKYNLPDRVLEDIFKIDHVTINRLISRKRIKIEHVFAYMKNFRILQRLNYYKTNKIELFFQSIANIYNLSKF